MAMPKGLKYALGFFGAIYILRNPDAAALTFNNIIDALMSVVDDNTTSKT